jgi:hypothetical protein
MEQWSTGVSLLFRPFPFLTPFHLPSKLIICPVQYMEGVDTLPLLEHLESIVCGLSMTPLIS